MFGDSHLKMNACTFGCVSTRKMNACTFLGQICSVLPCLSSSTLWCCLGQVTDLTGICAHLRANRCGARLVKTVNSCKGKTVGSFWGAVHAVLDSVVPILDRYRLGHQPVISTWPKPMGTFVRRLVFPLKRAERFPAFVHFSTLPSLDGPAVVSLLIWIRSLTLVFSKIRAFSDQGVVVMAQCTVGRKVLVATRIPHQV